MVHEIASADPFDLTGRVAVITGSTRGMGLAAAQLLADHGARVALVGRQLEGCEAAADEVNARFDEPRALPVACNIGKEDDRQRLFDAVLAAWGRVDILLCNASLNIWVGPIAELEEGVLRKTLDVNVIANHALMKLVLPGMLERGWGRIVTTTSIVGSVLGSPVDAAYAASKAALEALTKCVAVEHGARGVRANVIAPGTFRTEMARAVGFARAHGHLRGPQPRPSRWRTRGIRRPCPAALLGRSRLPERTNDPPRWWLHRRVADVTSLSDR